MRSSQKNIRIIIPCCLVSVLIGMTFGYIGLAEGKGTSLFNIAYFINSPAIIPTESFLHAIGKHEAFIIIVIVVVIYWILIGIVVAGIIIRMQNKRKTLK